MVIQLIKMERYSSDSRGFPAKEIGQLITGAWV